MDAIIPATLEEGCFPRALVVSPTRELAMQIHEQALKLVYSSHLRVCKVYGGVDAREQLQSGK